MGGIVKERLTDKQAKDKKFISDMQHTTQRSVAT